MADNAAKDIDEHSPEEILLSVYQSGCIGKSKHQYNLLKYLLEMKHEDRVDEIKEYVIAVDIFGRADSFDPSIDGIVRVEMHRLRKNLATFNLKDDPYKIKIPKGTYGITVTYTPEPIETETETPPPPAPVPVPAHELAQKKRPVFKVTLLALLGSLVFLSTTVWALNRATVQKEPTPVDDIITTSVLPRVFVKTQWEGDATGALLIKQFVTHALGGAPATISNSPDHDYVLDVMVVRVEDGSVSANLRLIEAGNDYVFDESFQCECSSITEVQNHILAIIERNFKILGAVPTYHAYNQNIAPNRLHLYRCFFDIGNVARSRETHFYSAKELEACLDPSVTTVPLNLTNIFSSRASLYFEALMHNIDLGYSEDILKDKLHASIKQSKKYDSSRLLAYYFDMRMVWIDSDRNPKKVRNMLAEAEKIGKTNPHVYMIGITYAYSLDDWENARRFAELPINISQKARGNSDYILLPEAITTRNYDEVAKILDRRSSFQSNITGLANVWLACHQSDTDRLSSGLKIIKRIDKYNSYHGFLGERHYAPILHETLSQLGDFEPCQTI